MADSGPFWEGTPGALHADHPGVVHVMEHVAGWIDMLAIVIMRIKHASISGGVRPGRNQARRTGSGTDHQRGTYRTGAVHSGRAHGLHRFRYRPHSDQPRLGDPLFLGLLVALRATVSHFLGREVRQITENPEL